MADIKGPSNIDEAKGRTKTAYGELTGDENMKREGQVDKLSGKVKEVTEKAREKAHDLFEKK